MTDDFTLFFESGRQRGRPHRSSERNPSDYRRRVRILRGGRRTPSSDADIVVVSPDFDEDDVYARRYYWDWDWNHDDYPTLDLIPLRPDEFRDFSSRSDHIVATAVETGDVFDFGERRLSGSTSSHA
jgi:hypothetical protein